MNTHDEDRDIIDRLHRLARQVEPPAPNTAADVRRGRARLRRRQALSVVGTVAAVVALAGGVTLLGQGEDGRPPMAADSASPTVLASESMPTSTASTCATPTVTASGIQGLDDPLKTPAIRSALTSYAQILGAHLDPNGRHLQRVPTGFTGNPELPCDPNSPVELGTKLSWTTPGRRGEAMVFVSVTNDWAQDQIHMAFDNWAPAYPPDQVTQAWTAGNGRAVAIERADGTVVAIQTDDTFGNNTPVGLTGFGFTADQLLTTAADPAFVLPR